MKIKALLFVIFFLQNTLTISADELWTSWIDKFHPTVKPQIESMVIDAQGLVWCSHASPANSNSVFRDGTWQKILGIPLGKLLAVGENDVIWGAWSGINSYDGNEQKVYRIDYNPDYNPQSDYYINPGPRNSLIFTSGNKAWLGVSFQPMESECGLFQLFLDRTVEFEKNKYNIKSKRLYFFQEPYKGVLSLAVDSAGLLWIGTEEDLWTYDGNEFKHQDEICDCIKRRLDTEDFCVITDLLVDAYDRIWLIAHRRWYSDDAMYSEKRNMVIVCYDGNESIWYDSTNSPLPKIDFIDLLMDHCNNLWVGTNDGLFCFDGAVWSQFAAENSGLCDNRIRCLAVASDNSIWIGTENGISRYTGEVIITSVDEDKTTPQTLSVIRSYPNPFNPSTTIEFVIPESGSVRVDIYTITGQKIRSLLSETLPAGKHAVVWDGRSDAGSAVSSGVYFVRLEAGKEFLSHRITLMK